MRTRRRKSPQFVVRKSRGIQSLVIFAYGGRKWEAKCRKCGGQDVSRSWGEAMGALQWHSCARVRITRIYRKLTL